MLKHVRTKPCAVYKYAAFGSLRAASGADVRGLGELRCPDAFQPLEYGQGYGRRA